MSYDSEPVQFSQFLTLSVFSVSRFSSRDFWSPQGGYPQQEASHREQKRETEKEEAVPPLYFTLLYSTLSYLTSNQCFRKTLSKRRRQHHATGEVNSPLHLFLLGGAFSPSLRSPPFDVVVFLCFLWVGLCFSVSPVGRCCLASSFLEW